MKYAILFVIAFILLSIAIDVSAIRNTTAPEKSAVEKYFDGKVQELKDSV